MPISHRVLFALGATCVAMLSCAGPAEPGSTSRPVLSPAVPEPLILVEAADWGSRPKPIDGTQRHRPERLTLHHAGVDWKAGDDPYDKIRRLQRWGQREKGWPDLPYHYLVAPDGRVFEGRPIEYAGETNTNYDTHGHALVQLWGNFERQQPTSAQIGATITLLARISVEHGIDPASLAGHRDVAETECPGKNLYRLLQDGSLLRAVRERLGSARRARGAR